MPTAHAKEAKVGHPVLELIRKRWSPCVFSEKPVEHEKLLSLFEAARWAPSCYNEQPWSMILGIAGEGEAHGKILSCLVDANVLWAQHAPVLGLTVSRLAFARNGKPNRHAIHDVGLAMGVLVIQATALGLNVHQMAGFRVEQAREVCEIPEGHEPVAAFAIGYVGDPSAAAPKLRERDEAERTRKPLEEFLFVSKHGQRWQA
jgi:nitroreductase